MGNLDIYESVRSCPDNALRTIQAGKLKGKSDINPVWRIKALTELFGPCGIGWKIENVKYWTEPGAGGEVIAWCSMELKINHNGVWSDGIVGVGGSMLVNMEKGKLVSNDEAYKMANTDAISVCCKMLGVAADVYWQADRTKYTEDPEPLHYCEDCTQEIQPVKMKDGALWPPQQFAAYTAGLFGRQLCRDCYKKAMDAKKAAEST